MLLQSRHERRTNNPIHRRTDRQATTGQGVPERHRPRKFNGPTKRPSDDECSGTSTDRSRTACTVGQGEGTKQEIGLPGMPFYVGHPKRTSMLKFLAIRLSAIDLLDQPE